MNRTEVGAQLRRLREGAGLSQSELGRRLNRESSTVSRIEAGKMDATIEVIAAWAVACGRTMRLDFPVEADPLGTWEEANQLLALYAAASEEEQSAHGPDQPIGARYAWHNAIVRRAPGLLLRLQALALRVSR